MKAIGFSLVLMMALATAVPQARAQGYFDSVGQYHQNYFDSTGRYHNRDIEQREQYQQQQRSMRDQENYRALLEQNRQEIEQLQHPAPPSWERPAARPW